MKVRVLEAVSVLPAPSVSVPVPVVIVFPLTVVGVIAPRVSVIAGVVVEVATEPLTPFAVTTETSVTVPEPPEASHDKTPDPLVVKTSPLSPSSVGRVKVMFPPVAPAWRVSVLAFVLFRKMICPVFVLAVPRVKEDAAVSVRDAKVGVELVAML